VLAGVYELRCRIRAAGNGDAGNGVADNGDAGNGAAGNGVAGNGDARQRDLGRLDALFDAALAICHDNVADALLVAALASLPYKRFPAVIPLAGISVTVPVSLESDGQYQQRLRNLPSMLLPDSPASGDRDKLPHFFGSAWLQMLLKSAPLACDIGILVEWCEQTFKLEGAADERDLLVNGLGARFADRIMEGRDAAPSRAFLSVPSR
jgi:hypothetical protein